MTSPNSNGSRPTQSEDRADRVAPDEVFDELIVRPGYVCQECFSRLCRRDPFSWVIGVENGDILAFIEYDLPDGKPSWNTADREYYERVRLPDRLDDERTVQSNKTTACAECGTFAPHRSPPPRSKVRAIADARRLSETLDEYGLTHNPDVLVARVEELWSRPENGGKDHDVFAAAVAAAIDYEINDP